MTVLLTERAASEIRRMMEQQHLSPEQTYLRVGVVGGGCSGYEYRLEFAPTSDPQEDIVAQSQGIRVAVDKRSAQFLAGTEIDIGDGLNNRGFIFRNPLAVRTCGCGTSFAI